MKYNILDNTLTQFLLLIFCLTFLVTTSTAMFRITKSLQRMEQSVSVALTNNPDVTSFPGRVRDTNGTVWFGSMAFSGSDNDFINDIVLDTKSAMFRGQVQLGCAADGTVVWRKRGTESK